MVIFCPALPRHGWLSARLYLAAYRTRQWWRRPRSAALPEWRIAFRVG